MQKAAGASDSPVICLPQTVADTTAMWAISQSARPATHRPRLPRATSRHSVSTSVRAAKASDSPRIPCAYAASPLVVTRSRTADCPRFRSPLPERPRPPIVGMAAKLMTGSGQLTEAWTKNSQSSLGSTAGLR